MLSDGFEAGTMIFVPKAARALMLTRSPSLSFFISLVSDCLAAGSKKNTDKFKLLALKMIRDICKLKTDEEGFSACLILLTEIVTNNQIDSQLLSATLADIVKYFVESTSVAAKERDEVYKPTLAKFIIYSFQALPDLEFTIDLTVII